MKRIFLTFALAIATIVGVQAQEKGDWYVGTGDIANTAWTEWSISPEIGYGFTDNLAVSVAVNQADSTADLDLDFSARYFWNGYFAYVATDGLSTDNMSIGAGKMFTFHKSVFVDPKIVYYMESKTTNLTLGFGLKF